ncbi:hypothetical protein VTK26DRAFT_2408 [Humicola hyalothermophila]
MDPSTEHLHRLPLHQQPDKCHAQHRKHAPPDQTPQHNLPLQSPQISPLHPQPPIRHHQPPDHTHQSEPPPFNPQILPYPSLPPYPPFPPSPSGHPTPSHQTFPKAGSADSKTRLAQQCHAAQVSQRVWAPMRGQELGCWRPAGQGCQSPGEKENGHVMRNGQSQLSQALYTASQSGP